MECLHELAYNGTKVQIHFTSASMDILGFEHPITKPADKKRAAQQQDFFLKNLSQIFELDPKLLFDSGDLINPNTEYFNDFLMDEIYREVNMKMDDTRKLRSDLDNAIYTKLSREEDMDLKKILK
jgi:hypothetical protein